MKQTIRKPKMTETTNEAIVLTEVTKIFRTGILKKKLGVENLSFQVSSGEVVGLLGANGSGKSTTIKLILGFLKPTQGEILICGHPAENRLSRSFIGYLPENPRFQKFLTAREALRYYGKLVGLKGIELKKRIEHLLDLVTLKSAADERVQGFSKGMCQRLAIAQALLNEPKLLIFDEPMSGLDPLGRSEIRRLIAQIHDEFSKATIFFSTHILGDIEQLCSSVILLKKGHLTKHCAISELLKGEPQRFDVQVRDLPDSALAGLKLTSSPRKSPAGLLLKIDGIDDLLIQVAQFQKQGATVVGITSHRSSLEEVLFAEPGSPPVGLPNEVSL
jgi:ABC-2 type transport system ATP-binding protein